MKRPSASCRRSPAPSRTWRVAGEDEGQREGLLLEAELAEDEPHEVRGLVGVALGAEAEVLAHLQIALPVRVREVAAV